VLRAANSITDDHGLTGDDDSPFLSIADFFSLISLSLIYLIVTFSPSAPPSESAIETITGVASGAGPASAVPVRIAYVAVSSSQERLLVRVIQPGAAAPDERQFELSDVGTRAASYWILNELLGNSDVERVAFYMDVNERVNQVHKSFLQMVAAAHAEFTVSMLFIDADTQLP
jgi:hypothetical protein